MIVRELLAKLGFDFDRGGAEEAETAMDRIKNGLKVAAGAATAFTAALSAAVLKTAQQADALLDMSARTGIATTALQELQHAAEKSGSSAEGMVQGMVMLSRTVKAATDGSKEQAATFRQLGVGLRNTDGSIRSTDAILLDLAERFAAMPNGVNKTALAMKVFGRSGADLVPLLNEGKAGIAALRAEAHQLGIVLDDGAITQGDRLWEALGRVKDLLVGLAYTISGPLLEPLADVVQAMVDWAKANRELIKTRVEAFARGLLAVFRGLATALRWVSENFRLLAIIGIAAATAALIVNAGAIATTVSWYGALGVASMVAGLKAAAAWLAAVAPVILLAAVLAAALLIAEDIYVFLQGGDSLIGELGFKFSRFLDQWTKIQADDPWWLVMLKDTVRFLTDLTVEVPKAIRQIKFAFAEWFAWMEGKWAQFKEDAASALTFGLYEADPNAAKREEGQAYREMTDFMGLNPAAPAPAGPRLYSPMRGRFGGGANPGASVQTSARPRVNVQAPQISNQITVVAQPGQDAGEIAGEVDRKINETLDARLREASAATGG